MRSTIQTSLPFRMLKNSQGTQFNAEIANRGWTRGNKLKLEHLSIKCLDSFNLPPLSSIANPLSGGFLRTNMLHHWIILSLKFFPTNIQKQINQNTSKRYAQNKII